MANAKMDGNSRQSLTAVSNVDGTTVVDLWADGTTHRLLTQNSVGSGTAAPITTPASLGLIFIDTVLSKVYISTGTASSADWSLMN